MAPTRRVWVTVAVTGEPHIDQLAEGCRLYVLGDGRLVEAIMPSSLFNPWARLAHEDQRQPFSGSTGPIMPSLNDMLARNRLPSPAGIAREIKGQATTAFKATRDEIKNIPGGLAAAQTQAIRNGAGAIVNGGLSAVREAAQKAMSGDFTGALSRLEAGPSDVMGKLGTIFGLSNGGSIGGGSDAEAPNTLEGALNRADPSLSCDWYCVLPTVNSSGAVHNLSWNYVEEATTPFKTWETRSVFAQGRNRHFASKYSVDGLRLTFYLGVDGAALSYLNAWHRAMLPGGYDISSSTGGGMGRPADYKRPIQIILISPDKQNVAILNYSECFPLGIDALNLDSGSSTRLTLPVSFSVGDVDPVVFGVNQNEAGASLLSQLTSGAAGGALNLARSAVKSIGSITSIFG